MTEKVKLVPGSIRGTFRARTKSGVSGFYCLGLLAAVEEAAIGLRKVVIVDGATVKVTDACINLDTILEAGAFLVEKISIGRQPFPSMAAIYIIRATKENIDAISKDFTIPEKKLTSGRKGPLYSQAHIYVTTFLDSTLMTQLAKSPAKPYIKTLQELYLDVIPIESRVFHLGNEAGRFAQLFANIIPDGPEPPTMAAELDSMAMRIASACATMEELPRVRYRRTTSDHRSARLAIRVQKCLEDLGVKLNLKTSTKSTLIIVDRTLDLVAPLLHEFTVQAMANDLLNLGPDGTQYECTLSSAAGPQKKIVSLDECDPMWVSLRHVHIADCSNIIIERFNKFLTENKAAVKSKNRAGDGDVTSLAELKDTMSALGEFHEMKRVFALHLSIAQDCLAASDRKKLIEVAGVEQNMVTGLDPEGDPVKDVWHDLAQLLDRPTLSSPDRARLLGIYLLTHQSNVSEGDRRALFDAARLDGADLSALRQLFTLAGSSKYRQRPSGRSRNSKRACCLDVSAAYDVSRFRPAAQLVMEDAAFEELDLNEFPFVKADTGSSGTTSSARTVATSLRNRPSSATGAGSSATTPSESGSIFLYMIGGCTFSEMRAAYEVSELVKRDFFVGGDTILTPTLFLNQLRSV